MKFENSARNRLKNDRSIGIFRYGVMAFALLSLVACMDDDDKRTTLQDSLKTAPEADDQESSVLIANFKLSSNGNVIPYPNNLLFSGSDDGTLNIPVEDNDSEGQVALKNALNSLDGFSTIAPISTTFNTAIDASTVVPGSGVRLFEVSLSVEGAVASITSELTGGVDFVATVSDETTLVVLPLKPLKPKTAYVVVITNDVKSTTGIAAKADLMYEVLRGDENIISDTGQVTMPAIIDQQDPSNLDTATQIAGLQQLTRVTELQLANYTVTADTDESIVDLTASNIVLSWAFKTQSVGDVLSVVKTSSQSSNPVSTINHTPTTESPLGAADIHVGSLEVPYYLTAPSENNPTAAIFEYWQGIGESNLTQFNPQPVSTSTQTIPLLVSIPKDASNKTENGWPVVIFQHGITSNRTALLGIADTLASVGMAAVAIDLPLHGLLGDEDLVGSLKLATAAVDGDVVERHFDMDLQDNTTSFPGPDGNVDSSGAHFINLQSILTSRDNVRQAVADLFVLRKAIETLDYDDDDNGPDFDTSKVYFIGHSLGAMVGGTYLALDDSVNSAVLASPGGGIAKVVDGSPTFGPIVAAGLGANGVSKGTADYESFMGAMQTALDSSDPINYAAQIAQNRGVLLFEIVGGSTALTDQVIPNNVPSDPTTLTVGSPTAGTDPLATLMGLNLVATTQTGTDQNLWVRFVEGHHSSFLTPKDAEDNDDATSASVTTEMQLQTGSFLASDGATLTISDTDIIASAP